MCLRVEPEVNTYDEDDEDENNDDDAIDKDSDGKSSKYAESGSAASGNGGNGSVAMTESSVTTKSNLKGGFRLMLEKPSQKY